MGAWLADHPEHYRAGFWTVTGDKDVFEGWAREVVEDGRTPYGEVRIEYPPGSLPFMVLPLVGAEDHAYRPRFIALMLVVDAVGLAGLMVIARRGGSWLGPWMWTLLVPLLGPIAYVRIDLVPAVATVWALERAHAGGWFGVGGWLGFGAAAKVYPALLLPLVVARRWRWRTVIGAATVLVVCVIPFVGSLPGLWRSVVGYHSQRGLQIESTWGALLLAVSHLGHPVQVVLDHGAFDVRGTGASALRAVSLALSVGGVATGAWVARKRVDPGSTAALAAVMFGTLAVVVAAGTVFSPQYMLWLSALGAVAASVAGRTLALPLALLVVANGLTQLVYPFHYAGLLENHAAPVATVLVRNLLVAAVGVLVLAKLWRGRLGAA